MVCGVCRGGTAAGLGTDERPNAAGAACPLMGDGELEVARARTVGLDVESEVDGWQ